MKSAETYGGFTNECIAGVQRMSILLLQKGEDGKMMRETDCYNMSDDCMSCKALIVDQCPVNCWAKISDPKEYILMLEALIYANQDTGRQKVADLKREIKELEKTLRFEDDWKEVYYDSLKRRGKGGSSEKFPSASKPKGDNRILETKNNLEAREKIKEATEIFEEEYGKLERLGYTSLGRSKIDSYTGEEIE